MDALWSDLRSAMRTLQKSPAFTVGAAAILAIGIAANAAVYSLVYSVLLRPLPYPTADRLVRLWEEHPGGETAAGNRWLSNRTYSAWLQHPRTIDGIGAYATYDYTVDSENSSERLAGSELSPEVFPLLGATAAAGRLLAATDAVAGAEPVVLLSDPYWRETLGADPHVIGQSLLVDGRRRRIIGVMPAGFSFPDRRVRFWIPYVMTPPAERAISVFTALGRLRAGSTPADAAAEGTSAARSTPRPIAADLWFGKGGPVVVHARPLGDDMAAAVRPALWLLAGAVALMLLIVCANVGNLFLTRTVVRQREFAVRAAIGASRLRLARQLLAESAVIAAAGGIAGVLLASWLIRLVPALAPSQFPRLDDVRMDGRVLACAALATLLAAVLSGVAPALKGSRPDAAESLRGGDGASADGFRGRTARRLRDMLLIAEAAIAVTLLIGASLLAHSFVHLTSIDPGYTTSGVLIAQITLPPTAPPERTSRLIDRLLEELRAMPGVVAAGAGNMAPYTKNTVIVSFPAPDAPDGTRPLARVVMHVVTPGFAEALGLHLRSGRLFAPEDANGSGRPMLVNDEFVRRYLTGGDVVGRQFANLLGTPSDDVPTVVIGVVGNVLKDGQDQRPQPEIYFVQGSHGGAIRRWVDIVLRGRGDAASLAPSLRARVRAIEPSAVVGDIDTLAHAESVAVATPRFSLGALGGIAGIALLLAGVGLYGVIAYSVSQRRRELGLRAALGATRRDLLQTVLFDGVRVTAIGMTIGIAGALALTRLLQGVLFGVDPFDPAAFVAGPIILAVTACAACLVPARRAARVDPMVALRSE